MKSFSQISSILRRKISNLFSKSNIEYPKITLPLAQSNIFDFLERYSKHRKLSKLYDLKPAISDCSYVYENSTIIGEAMIHDLASTMYKSVIKGDENSIKIGTL
jgi:hypothetical protein